MALGRRLSGLAIIFAGLVVSACEGELHLTQAPVFGVSPSASAQHTTMVGVAVPMNREALSLEIGEAVKHKPIRISRWLRKAGCQQAQRRCFGARIVGRIVIADGVEVQARPNGDLRVRVPLTYALTARGLRAARKLRDDVSGTIYLTQTLSLGLSRNLAPAVAIAAGASAETTRIPVFQSAVDVEAELRKLRSQFNKVLVPAVRAAVERAQFAEGITRGWAALQRPIVLSDEDRGETAGPSWIIGQPVRVARVAFFDGHDGRLAARANISVRLTLGRGESPRVDYVQPLLASFVGRPAEAADEVVIEPDTPATSRVTEIPFTSDIAIDGLTRAIAGALKDGSELAMRATPTSPEVTIRVSNPDVRPAQRFLAISFDADVLSPPRFAGQSGKLHLVGRAVVDKSGRRLIVQGLSFPVIAQPDVRRPRTPIPFESSAIAERIAPALSMDLVTPGDEALTQAGRMFRTEISSELTLSGRFVSAGIESVAPSAGGVRLTTMVRGDVVLMYRPNQAMTAERRQGVSSGLVDEIRQLSKN